MSQAKAPTLTRRTNVVLIGLFLVLLWLPSLDSVFHIDWTPPRSENRAMAAFPNAPKSWRGMQACIVGLESWFNDHFGFRKCLVMWNNKLRWSLFKDRNTERVLVGKDGWLFTMDARMIDHYSGLLQLTPAELHDWQLLLEKRRDWLASHGIAYVFVVTPDKESIYPEALPDWVTKVNPQTKVDQFFAYMREHSTVPVVDLRKAIIDAKQIGPTYLQTDTHWNAFGGFIGYQQLVLALDKALPATKLEPIPLSSFTLANQLEAGGDLAKILGLSVTESNEFLLKPDPNLPKINSLPIPPEDPKHPRYTDNPRAKGRAMVFHDSFALRWVRFLAYHFNQVIFLWQYDLDRTWIEREKPDIVISEMNERFFDIEHPAKLMAQEALN